MQAVWRTLFTEMEHMQMTKAQAQKRMINAYNKFQCKLKDDFNLLLTHPEKCATFYPGRQGISLGEQQAYSSAVVEYKDACKA